MVEYFESSVGIVSEIKLIEINTICIVICDSRDKVDYFDSWTTRIYNKRLEIQASPNRCAPLVLMGRISLCAPLNFAQLVINRRRICVVLKLAHHEPLASPVAPACRCILSLHIRRRLLLITSVELRQLRKRQHVELLFFKRDLSFKSPCASHCPIH